MNKELVIRLSKYRRLLYKLRALGLARVFSNNLGDAISVAPSLVRKDFSMLQIPGNKRGGYDIEELIECLDTVLGRDKPQNVVVVGCGRIGTALMQYREFSTEGIRIVAGFDIEPKTIRNPTDVPVYNMEELPEFVKTHEVRVGILATPESVASEVLDQMLRSGIRGVLNFAPVELKCLRAEDCPDNRRCVVHNVNLGIELEHLFYQINVMDEKSIRDSSTGN
jgi:redox-sensing transcriptional repressor